MKNKLITLLFLVFLATPNIAFAQLSNQIIIDPSNPLYLVYNNSQLDPFFGAGPGDPEDFLYRSDWQQILSDTRDSGSNTMYAIVVNSYNGAGDCAQGSNCNPFYSGTNTVDPSKLNDIYTRVKALSDAGIVTWLFLYDDSLCVFGNCGSSTVPQAETDFINALVNKMETIPNLIWVVAEEYQEAFGSGSQRVRNIAKAIKQADNNNHIVGVHHTTGDDTFDFKGDANIDQFSHQPSPTSVSGLHSSVLSAVNSVKGTNHHTAMVEAHPYHENLLKQNNRTELRRSGWANALAGVHVLYLCTWRHDRSCPSPSTEMLSDWGRIATFMESTDFNKMSSNDGLKQGSTQYVLANPSDSFIAYTDSYSSNMGVSSLTSGTYLLKWLDTVSGSSCTQQVSVSGTSATWTKPSGYGNELALYIKKGTGTTNCGTSPTSTPTPTGPTSTPSPSPTQGPTPTPGDEIIWNLQVRDGTTWNIKSNLQTQAAGGDLQYSDRGWHFSSVDPNVVGADWIQTANDSASSTGIVAEFDLKQDATVYVAHDTRVSPPSWMSDWTDTTWELENAESNPKTFRIYAKDFSANPSVSPDVSLRENGSSSISMYTVIVQGSGTSVLGDANGDQIVDGIDFIVFASHFGQSTGNGASDGDFSGNGTVGSEDYDIWFSAYGGTSPPIPTPSPTPPTGGTPTPTPTQSPPGSGISPTLVASGAYPAIEVDSLGNVHLAYARGGTLWYRKFTASSGAWSNEQSTGVSQNASYRNDPDIVTDSQNNPHIIGGEGNDAGKYVYWNGSSWVQVGTFNRDTALAIDNQDTVYVVERGGHSGGYIGVSKRTAGAGSFSALPDPSVNAENDHVYTDIFASPTDNSVHIVYRHGVPTKCAYTYSSNGGSSWSVGGIAGDDTEAPSGTVSSTGEIFAICGAGGAYQKTGAPSSWSSLGNAVGAGSRYLPVLSTDSSENLYAASFGGKYNIRVGNSWTGEKTVSGLSSAAKGFMRVAGANDGQYTYAVWEEGNSNPLNDNSADNFDIVFATIDSLGVVGNR